ncbi:hypothetical protein QTP70_008142 [Hemibagrus guttatus]|uniref:Uncharacterized protein n=1 Tax=Hemibagrus guttatus TaxID=175788 RepID=A0AAE0R6M8_9TELE|nr:hypothetical protein QTP70_008142 [Hemibagrus guttatus]
MAVVVNPGLDRSAQVLKWNSSAKARLAMLGIFFSIHSAVLIEDVPLKEEDHHDIQNPLQSTYAVYNQVGYNCFIAAGIYVVIGFVSFVQVRLNKRNDYLVR